MCPHTHAHTLAYQKKRSSDAIDCALLPQVPKNKIVISLVLSRLVPRCSIFPLGLYKDFSTTDSMRQRQDNRVSNRCEKE